MSKKEEKILRVGIIQGGRIIEERLLRKRAPVSVGWSPKNTFVLPGSKLPKSFTLFDVKGSSYVLNFRDDTKGRLSIAGEVLDMGDVKRHRLVRKKGSSYQIPLDSKARGKIVLGDVTLLFQLVAPPPLPPKLKLPASARGGWFKSIDWNFVGICVVSAFLQVVPVSFIVLHDWPEPKRTEMIPDRFVSLIVDVPKEKKPKKQEIKQGEGQMEGEEKASKKPRKKPRKGDQRKKATAQKQQDPEAAARAAAARKRALAKKVRGKTLLRFITAKAADGESGTAGIVDTLAQGAARSRIDEAFAGAMGVATATAGSQRARHGGAAATAGEGKVAGIESLGSTTAHKTIKGTGRRKERRVRANIKVSGPSKTFGTGRMSPDQIAAAVRRRIKAVKSCYERELKKDPTLKGKIVIQFTIGEVGRVISSRIASSTMKSSAVGNCILARLRRWRFPKPEGGSVTVSYPFVFFPGS